MINSVVDEIASSTDSLLEVCEQKAKKSINNIEYFFI